jgi:TPR repeat protein
MARLIRRISRRQVRPGSSGAEDPEHAVKNVSCRAPRAATFAARRTQFSTRNVRLDGAPLRVGQIHRASRSKPRSAVDPVRKPIGLRALGSRRVMRRALVSSRRMKCALAILLLNACSSSAVTSPTADPIAQAFSNCERGDNVACGRLGSRYEYGDGVARDDGRAVKLYKKACDGGLPLGCASLGELVETGRGTRADMGEAAALYQQGCSGGAQGGCAALGRLYSRGTGVPFAPVKAVDLLQRACETTPPLGCGVLGQIYLEGRGVPADSGRGDHWFDVGCRAHDEAACAALHR